VKAFRRREPAPLTVAPGESVLAWTRSTDGRVVAGTRDAVYVDGERIPWEQVEAADWDRDTDVFRISEVGTWGEPRAQHALTLAEPGRLLELVRERVTASVVLQRHVPVTGRHGLRVIARRAPRGDQPITWAYEFDAGIDPDDPDVQAAAAAALRVAREDVGLP
jgi:hypothetical protein